MSIFFDNNNSRDFTWSLLGDIELGRGDLGQEMPVVLYRLMQFTIFDVMSKDFGKAAANNYFRRAGYLAGSEFAKNVLDLSLDINAFLSHLQTQLKILKIGKMRVEDIDTETGKMIIVIEEDLDCSGLPITGETVCSYDEGFLAGVLFVYTGKNYVVTEIDCWSTGDRVCRFEAKIEE